MIKIKYIAFSLLLLAWFDCSSQSEMIIIFKDNIEISKEIKLLENVFRTDFSKVFSESNLNILRKRPELKICTKYINRLSGYYVTITKKSINEVNDLIKSNNISTIEYLSYQDLAKSTESCNADIKCETGYESLLKVDSFHTLTKGEGANLILFELKNGTKQDKPMCFNKGISSALRGRENEHLLKTLGVIYSQKNNDCCLLGIAPESNLKKMYISGSQGSNQMRSIIEYLKDSKISKFGDIALFEFMFGNDIIERYYEDINLSGIEYRFPFLDLFSILNCLGVTVIEPSGNCKNRDYSKEIADSGAILVGAAYNVGDKYINFPQSGIGTRVDVFGLGNIKSIFCDEKKANICATINCYCQTSAASAIVAGFALGIQSIYKNRTGRFLAPEQMRNIFRNPTGVNVFQNSESTPIGHLINVETLIGSIPQN